EQPIAVGHHLPRAALERGMRMIGIEVDAILARRVAAGHVIARLPIHHRRAGALDEALLGKVVVMDHVGRMMGGGRIPAIAQHPRRTVDAFPPAAHEARAHAAGIEPDTVFGSQGRTGGRTWRRTVTAAGRSVAPARRTIATARRTVSAARTVT